MDLAGPSGYRMHEPTRVVPPRASTADPMPNDSTAYGASSLAAGRWGEGQAFHEGLVGREIELTNIASLVSSARAGSGGGVVLRGEPGTGKTALLESAAAMAADLNVFRLCGSDDDEVDPELRLRRTLASLTRDGHFPNAVEASVTGIAREVRRDTASQSAPTTSLTVVLLELFRRAATSTSSPVLVVVDDAQWLPEQFTSALVQAALQIQHEPIAVVLAWSDIPHLQLPEPDFARLNEHHLDGLSLEQASFLIDSQATVRPTRRVLRTVVDRTLGNPCATIDACARLSNDELGGWRPLPAPLRIGTSLASTFGRCLSSLPQATRDALCVVAAGSELPLGVAETAIDHLSGDHPGTLEDLIEPALEAGVITTRNGRVHFDHPLVAAAAFQLAGEDLQLEAHDALARAFSARGDIERTVVHAAAGTSGKSGRVTRLLAQASHIALSRNDPTTAAANEEMASDFAVEPDGAAHHLTVAARIWTQEGWVERAVNCLDRAILLAVSDATRADVSYWRARARLARDVGPHVAAELLAAGRASESFAPHRAVVMLADSAACNLLAGDYSEAIQAAQSAMQVAQSASDHSEALASAILAVAETAGGTYDSVEHPSSTGTSDISSRASQATTVIMSQTQGFAGSPQLALTLGLGLLENALVVQAARWVAWTERCANGARDRPLLSAALIVRACVAFHQGHIDDGLAICEAAHKHAEASGQGILASQALALQVELEAALGLRERCFEHATRVLAIPAAYGSNSRSRALAALGELELQRGDAGAAAAWLSAARREATPAPRETLDSAGHQTPGAADIVWLPPLVEALALSGRHSEANELLEKAPPQYSRDLISVALTGRSWHAQVRGMLTVDVAEASELFAEAVRGSQEVPMRAARIELRWGQRLARAGQVADAEIHLEIARSSFASLDARGWAERALAEIEKLRSSNGELGTPFPTPDTYRADPWIAAPKEHISHEGEDNAGDRSGRATAITMPAERSSQHVGDAQQPGPHPAWRVTMLGRFCLKYRGIEVTLPPSLPAQAIKIIAIRQRLLVDELVELLWPDAEPGVGARRLRNVLFRVRSACGDLLTRDSGFIRMSPEAEVDITAFRSLAERALSRQAAPDEAIALASEALSWYGGELLPGDRYADWAASTRESLAQLHLHLMDLLVNDAVSEGRTAEALSMLERLIDIDPYEEHHYLLAARLHADSGNRRRAMSALARAERAMLELGVPPSELLTDYKARIESS